MTCVSHEIAYLGCPLDFKICWREVIHFFYIILLISVETGDVNSLIHDIGELSLLFFS